MITKIYKNINIELKEDGSYFCIYEYTPILKYRKDITFGAGPENTYNLNDIKIKIDNLINNQESEVQ